MGEPHCGGAGGARGAGRGRPPKAGRLLSSRHKNLRDVLLIHDLHHDRCSLSTSRAAPAADDSVPATCPLWQIDTSLDVESRYTQC
ncbi:hypothetical protein EVAR_52303_1 [Eumeta japonica]|uniref:Uncharacterized protein n=1 Tax=Eumeta variegata TaxID=151549 RepID=A0A4C1Y5Q0_EUMVA|nr:hypothetical protein EVAR_52303_1 [Eumeta japonica]